MIDARKKLRLVLAGVTAACLACSTGCDDRSGARQAERDFQQQYAKDYKQQKDVLGKQNAEWERQTKRLDAQDKRYDALLTKWEESSERVDALLDRWDRILQVLEERSREGKAIDGEDANRP